MDKEQAKQLLRQRLVQERPEMAGVFAMQDLKEAMVQKDSSEGTAQLEREYLKIENSLERLKSKGEPGYTPVKGVDYFDGKDGYSPVKGVDYFDGEDGIQGIPGPKGPSGETIIGPKGEDGSPDSPEQIAQKLNTLEGVINISVIKGALTLDDIKGKLDISDIKNWNQPAKGKLDQRWHGGGLSNITGFITAGTNVTVTGSGTRSSPYVIASTGGSGTPGGSNTQAQYNNSGAFGGTSGLTLSATKVTSASIGLGSDATGDIYYNGGSGALTRLGIGSTGQVLTVTAGIPSWAASTGGVTSIAGTANRITASASTGAVTLDIAATYVGQTSITTLGTITTGVWNGTTIAVANGGTGQTSYTNGQLLIGNTTGNTLAKATLTGTTNQVVVTNGGGTITLSTPQDIATSSNPQFATIELGAASDTTLARVSAGVVSIEGVTVATASNTLALTNKTITSSTNSLGGVTMAIGSDATGDIYYRSSGGVLTRLGIGSTGQVLKVTAGLPSWGAGGGSSPLTTKGDLYGFSTVDARIPVGTNGYFLQADSGSATGVSWVASTPGGSSGASGKIQLSDGAGGFTSSANFFYDVATNQMHFSAALTADVNVTNELLNIGSVSVLYRDANGYLQMPQDTLSIGTATPSLHKIRMGGTTDVVEIGGTTMLIGINSGDTLNLNAQTLKVLGGSTFSGNATWLDGDGVTTRTLTIVNGIITNYS